MVLAEKVVPLKLLRGKNIMVDLDIRINLIGQTDNSLIIEFSVPDEWSNIQAIAKTATIQELIDMYEAITPDEIKDINDSVIINRSFHS